MQCGHPHSHQQVPFACVVLRLNANADARCEWALNLTDAGGSQAVWVELDFVLSCHSPDSFQLQAFCVFSTESKPSPTENEGLGKGPLVATL